MSEVRLTKARTFELDPSKKYLIEVKKDALSEEDIVRLGDQIKKIGITNAVIVRMPKGNGLKITEAK